ncbi:MAG: divergent polysaccharide deacetylase family protein [Alphaproteobacteria bacterium]|nr:divergent polysaccharide deacetylase family protein [Alphaproteobacteria bacterium]
MVRLTRKKFKKSEEKSEFFTFDSEKIRLIKQKRFFARFISLFTSYPWWFYYLSYVIIFSLSVAGLLMYAFYAPASINLSVTERSFLRVPVKQYIYPISLQNMSEKSQQTFWQSYFDNPTNALNPNFIKLTNDGPIPVSYQGTPIWQEYRSSYHQPIDNSKKQLVLIIADLGNHKEVTEFAIDSNAEVTLEFNPYADFLGQWVLFARSKGHEVLLHAPISETAHFVNFDPGSLGFDFSNDETQANNKIILNQLMAVTTGYIGISMPYATSNPITQQNFRDILRVINQHTLISVIHDNYLNDARAAGQNLSNSIDWQFYNYNTRDNHQRKLDDLLDATLNSDKEIFVARLHAYNFSINDIITWINDLDNIQIVPLSYLYDPQ